MAFENDKLKAETDLWRELAAGGNTAHYTAMKGYGVAESLAAIVNRQLGDGTAINPYI